MPSFLSPLFLVGIAAAAIPVAIHLFYRRTEPVIDFAAMRYLRRAPVEHSRRRRLRELILLALRVTALVLLALAFARPYFSDSVAAGSGAATMVLVDTSASMSAPAQFEAARERAAQAIREAPPTHAVGLAALARSATVIAPISQDRAGALAALAQLEPGAGATRYRAALEGAADAFDGRSGRIVVVTDLQESGWDAASEGGIPVAIGVEVEDVGAPPANLAVTSLRVEAADAIAVVQNYSSSPGTDQVIFALDGRRVGAVPVTLGPGDSLESRIALPGVTSGALSASITDRNGYAADNTRYAVVDAADSVSVLVVTATGHPSEALYLQRALSVAEGTHGFRVRSLSGAAFSALDEQALAQVGVIALLGTRGVAQAGRARLAEFVRRGGGLLLTAGPDVDPAIVKEALNGVAGTSWVPAPPTALTFAPNDGRHPVFRPLGGAGTLGNVGFSRTVRITTPDEGADVIARYSNGSPALVEERTGGGRVLVFGSDLNYRWNDFPLQPAFVPFVHEAIRYLASPRSLRTEYLVGEVQGVSVPGVVQLGPDGRIAGDRGVPPAANGALGRHVAVNVDPRESDPARMTAETFQAGISRLNAAAARDARNEARDQEDTQSLWWYALLVMVVSLAAEGVIGRRLG